MQYSFVIEKSNNGYSAYVPDLPGCIAAADTREETECLIRQGIIYYLESLKELNQSQDGMCICRRRRIVPGIWQECFGP